MIRAALDAARAAGSLALLRRVFPGEPRVNGYVLAVSERLALVHQFHDFLDDGWTVLRIADIEEVVTEEARGFFARAFRERGLAPRLPPLEVPIATMAEALRALRREEQPVIVECETAEGGDADRYDLGAVCDVTDLHVHLRPVDGAGHWVPVEAIALGRITRLHVATPYLTTFLRYADPPPEMS
ncbi:MAG: hypothetical protein K8W52_33395 [Deltaproteobacteria bacterium]|nr:hypothetical protein [Deltaproteobacteria bacterium]